MNTNLNAPAPIYPFLTSGSARLWISNINPTQTENVVLDIGNFWYNNVLNTFWVCIDNTVSALVWHQLF